MLQRWPAFCLEEEDLVQFSKILLLCTSDFHWSLSKQNDDSTSCFATCAAIIAAGGNK